MKRLRSDLKESVLHNEWNSDEITFKAEEVHTDLTSDGIQSHTRQHVVALSCGHIASPAGLCSVCERAVCAVCSVMCSSCGKPVGNCHSVHGDDGQTRCSECHAARRRGIFARLLLSPFVRFKDKQQ